MNGKAAIHVAIIDSHDSFKTSLAASSGNAQIQKQSHNNGNQ